MTSRGVFTASANSRWRVFSDRLLADQMPTAFSIVIQLQRPEQFAVNDETGRLRGGSRGRDRFAAARNPISAGLSRRRTRRKRARTRLRNGGSTRSGDSPKPQEDGP